MATRKKAMKKRAPSRAKAKSRSSAKRAPARRAARPKTPASATKLVGASPSFTVNDIEKSAAFYRDVLGFAVTERWEMDGQLRGVMLAAGDAVFMLGQDDWQKGRDRQKGVGFRVYCPTRQDVRKLAEKMKSRGATLDAEPADDDWAVHFAVTDPDGFKITFANLKRR